MIELAYDYSETITGNLLHKLKVVKVDSHAVNTTRLTSGFGVLSSAMIINADIVPIGSYGSTVQVFASVFTELISIPTLNVWQDGAFRTYPILSLPFKIKIPSGIPWVAGTPATGQMLGMLDTDSVDIVNRYVPSTAKIYQYYKGNDNPGTVKQTRPIIRQYVSQTNLKIYNENDVIDSRVMNSRDFAQVGVVGIPWVNNYGSPYCSENKIASCIPSYMGSAPDAFGNRSTTLVNVGGYIIGRDVTNSLRDRLRTGNVMCNDGSFDLGGESTSVNVLHDPTIP